MMLIKNLAQAMTLFIFLRILFIFLQKMQLSDNITQMIPPVALK